jgi:hypothetical protein
LNSEGWDVREVVSEGHDGQNTLARRPRLQLEETERPLTDGWGVSAGACKWLPQAAEDRVWVRVEGWLVCIPQKSRRDEIVPKDGRSFQDRHEVPIKA